MLFRHKNELQVDLGDLTVEKERLAAFLQTQLKTEVNPSKDKITLNQENISLTDLHHAVKKYLNHRNFGVTHYTTLEGSTVKINKFKGHEKKGKDKHNKNSGHQTMSQSWGL